MKRERATAFSRTARFAGWAVAVSASALCFPVWIPWMITCWLAAGTVAAIRSRGGSRFLIAWIPVVLVKRVAWSPLLTLLVWLTVFAVIVERLRSSAPDSPGGPVARRRLPVIAVWIGWLCLAWAWKNEALTHSFPSDLSSGPVVCLGDSLTAGNHRDGSYPDVLEALIRQDVVNEGHDGITTGDALERLPAILSLEPSVVVIELSGHDFLRGVSRGEAKRNLQLLIGAFRKEGSLVILIEIPRGFIVDGFGGLERELARENDIDLIDDSMIRRLVLFSPYAPPGIWMDQDSHYSDDGLHPNARGNAMMARVVARSVRSLMSRQRWWE